MTSIRLRALFAGICLLAAAACSGGTASPDASMSACGACPSGESCNETTGTCESTKTDAGRDAGASPDAGHDAGTSMDAGHDGGTPTDGGSDAGVPPSVGGLVALYQAKGTVMTGTFPPTVSATLLVPVVGFARGATSHAYNDQQGRLGCTADHFDSAHPPPVGADAGNIQITGYQTGQLLQPYETSPSTITCQLGSSGYNCTYSDGTTVATAPYDGSANPLGSGMITFSGSGGSDFGAFTLQGAADGTLTVSQDLSKVQYSTTNPTTLDYSCAGGCGSSLVIASLLATDNSPSNPTGNSATSGSVSCVEQANGSIVIPGAAIAAMFANDSALQSVVTTVIRVSSTVPTTKDSAGQTVAANVGEGVFGIASK